MLDDVKMLAMPDCLEAGERHEFTFQARVRNKEGKKPFEALNIFVYFKQRKSCSSRRGYEQRSIVFACRHYYSDIMNRILSRFADVVEALPMYQQMLLEPNPQATRDALDSAIEVCFQHFCQWPDPVPGNVMTLPFYGEMFEFVVPDIAPYMLQPPCVFAADTNACRRPGDMCFGEGCGVLGEVNLMAILAPLGLLPHIWTLWELMITGQDIVVYSPSAAICSSVVRALVSLTTPLACCADMRCYINNYDNDTDLFSTAADMKRTSRCSNKNYKDDEVEVGELPSRCKKDDVDTQSTLLDAIHIGNGCSPQCIVGITNPFLLRSFASFQNAIFIPSEEPLVQPVSPQGGDSEGSSTGGLSGLANLGLSYFFKPPKGLHDLENTSVRTPSELSPSRSFAPPLPRAPPRLYNRVYGPAKVSTINPATVSLEVVYDQWCVAGGAGRSKAGKSSYRKNASKKTHVLLVLREAPVVAADKSVLHRLSQFSLGAEWDGSSFSDNCDYEDSDAVTIGGLLLREHIKMLTMTILKPFDSFFSPVACRSYDNTARSRTSILPSPTSLSVRRMGAKSLWLYADSTTILGAAKAGDAIATFLSFYQVGNLPPSFSAMSKSKVGQLLLSFSKTTTFRVWVDWRRNIFISQLCWSMMETSKDLSLDQLLAYFAVEQSKDVLHVADISILIQRVENTIANIRAINGASSSPVKDDSQLCGHMLQHLVELTSLVTCAPNTERVLYSVADV